MQYANVQENKYVNNGAAPAAAVQGNTYSQPSQSQLDSAQQQKRVAPTRFWKWFDMNDFVKDYLEVVARGNFGEVKKAKFESHETLTKRKSPALYAGELAALKFPLASDHDFAKAFDELSHEVSCTVIFHPNLVNYIGGLSLKSPPRVGVVMEFVNTNLRHAVENDARLKEFGTQLDIAKQVASGMNFLHALNPVILHRDLRPPNILINEDLECKIADFGISDNLSYSDLGHKSLYTSLVPPECREQKPYTKKGDVYFFGWVLVELSLGRKPDEDYSLPATESRLSQVLIGTKEKEGFHKVVSRCLLRDPEKRPSFYEICNELNKLLELTFDLEIIAQNDVSVSPPHKIGKSILTSSADSLGRKLVHQYAIFGNLNGLRELVKILGKGCLEEVDKYGTTCAHFAARNGNLEILKFLADNGFNKFTEMEKRFETIPLTLAIAMKHLPCVEFLTAYSNQSALNAALISACTEGNLDLVKLFLDKGANIQCCDPDLTRTPLGWASRNGHLEIVKYLVLERGADINKSRSDIGSVPAYEANHRDVLEFFIQQGVNVNAPGRTDDGQTLLIDAAQENHNDMVQLLLESGANADQARDDGYTPLITACQGGNKDAVSLLFQYGVDVNKGTKEDGQTPLFKAAKNNYPEIVVMLLKKGANVNQGCTDDGQTPLIAACMNGHNEVISLLLANGADINQPRTDSGSTPLMLACANGHLKTVELLLKHGARINEGTKSDGQTALFKACNKGNKEIAAFLIAQGADVNQACTDDGQTPLIAASYADDKLEVASLLLAHGADPNLARTDTGSTALMIAAARGNKEIVALLKKQKNTNLAAKNKNGKTALEVAIENGKNEIVQILS